jgi:multidrug efflux pump subunit AcrA (membrane-fusion protein)
MAILHVIATAARQSLSMFVGLLRRYAPRKDTGGRVIARAAKRSLFWLMLIALVISFVAGSGLAAPLAAAVTGNPPLQESQLREAVLQIQGRLVPGETVSLASPASARAERVFVQAGQRVAAGTVLVQLDSYPQRMAEVAAAELQVLLARNALEVLDRDAPVELAQAEVLLAEARKEQAFAADHLASLSKPTPQADIDQGYANLLLAEKVLTRTRDDLAKAQKHYANKQHFIWFFMNARQFKLLLTGLEGQVADSQRHLEDAREKYEDLKAPVDPIDLDLAVARLAEADATLTQATRQRDELAAGPDPDSIELAQTRLDAAESDLAAAQADLRQAQIVAPISGLAVAVDVKAGEWMPGGQPVIVIAVMDRWEVETDEIEERDVTTLQPGQPVHLFVQALPDLQLEGRIEWVDLLYREEDGDIYYGMTVELPEADPRLRWGMTAEIEIDPAGLLTAFETSP